MGIYDRDYYRSPQPSGVGSFRMWSITTWLIIVNVAVFVIGSLLLHIRQQQFLAAGFDPRLARSPLEEFGAFSIYTAVLHGQIWRAITCQFLHANLMHLLMNMIALWLFGPIVELHLGPRRYTFFYLLCGIAGPIMYTALWGLGILTPATPEFLLPSMVTYLVGASAGIFGVLLAAAYLAPDRMVFLYFFALPLRYFAWIMMGIAAYTVIVHGSNAGGQAAHLGGGLLGWFLIRSNGVLNLVAPKRTARRKEIKDWSRDFNR